MGSRRPDTQLIRENLPCSWRMACSSESPLATVVIGHESRCARGLLKIGLAGVAMRPFQPHWQNPSRCPVVLYHSWGIGADLPDVVQVSRVSEIGRKYDIGSTWQAYLRDTTMLLLGIQCPRRRPVDAVVALGHLDVTTWSISRRYNNTLSHRANQCQEWNISLGRKAQEGVSPLRGMG